MTRYQKGGERYWLFVKWGIFACPMGHCSINRQQPTDEPKYPCTVCEMRREMTRNRPPEPLPKGVVREIEQEV